MNYIDAATRWSLSFWAAFGLAPVLYQSLPWATWRGDANLAAWVQAFGSIGAILMTGAAIVLQNSLAQRAAQREQLRAQVAEIEGARRLVRAVSNLCQTSAKEMTDGGPAGIPNDRRLLLLSQLGAVSSALSSIPAHTLVHWEQTEATVTAAALAQTISQVLATQSMPAAEFISMAREFAGYLDDREGRMAAFLGFPPIPMPDQERAQAASNSSKSNNDGVASSSSAALQ